jgi:DNA-binding Xre family transcriptional regulator
MRLRIPELLESRGLTAYALSKQSNGRISLSAAFRYVQNRGRMRYFDSDMLETLCEVLDVAPGELLERERSKGQRSAKGRAR